MSKPKLVEAEKAIGYKIKGDEFEVTQKEGLLYAAGIGFNLDPLKEEDFKYTNELAEGFSIFPTMTSTMHTGASFQILMSCPHIPDFPLHNLLHGEEKLFMVKPQVSFGPRYQIQSELIDIQDKGKNGVVYVRNNCYEIGQKGQREKVYHIDRSFFVKGLGGFGYKGNNSSAPVEASPKRTADKEFIVKTYPNQAFVYRLCEDPNPLHIDPNMAALGGFEKPIIHGLATYGTVARGLSQNLLDNDHTQIQSIESKFVGHVFPGETLKIKVWNDGNKRYFEAETIERGKKAVTGIMTVRPAPKL